METHKLYICNKINNLIVLRLTFVLQMFIFYNSDSVLTEASVLFRKSSSASWPLILLNHQKLEDLDTKNHNLPAASLSKREHDPFYTALCIIWND